MKELLTWQNGAILVGTGAAAYLVFDTVQSSMSPDSGTKSLVERAVDAVVQSVAPVDVPAVKTGMPMYSNGTLVDPPNASFNNMTGVAHLANELLFNNASFDAGCIVAAFASCEVQRGSDLGNNCHNCSLFNVHWRNGDPYPRVRIGAEIMPSFSTGRPNLVAGYRECITRFGNWLRTAHPHDGPEFLAACRALDTNRAQIAIASMNYSGGYTRTVQGGQITGSRFLIARLRRLVGAGLLPSNAITRAV